MAIRTKKLLRRARKKISRRKIEAESKGQMIWLSAEADVGEQAEFLAAEEGQRQRSFKMRAYSGGELRLGWRPIVVDLAGLRVSKKPRPIFRQHDPTRIVGHTTSISNDGARLDVEGVVSGVGQDAEEIVRLSDNGFPWQASIGAYSEKMIAVDDGESVKVNGRTFKGPLYVVRKATLAEISFVPLGADDNTSAKIAANAEVFDMNFEKWLEERGFVLAELNDQQIAYFKAQYEAENDSSGAGDGAGGGEEDGGNVQASTPSAPPPIDVDRLVNAASEAAVAAVNRQQRIRDLCAGDDDLLARASREGWDEQRTELEVLRAARGSGPTIIARRSQGLNADAIAAAMLISANMPEDQTGRYFNEQAMNAAVSQDYRGFGLHELIYASVQAGGGYIRPGRIDNAAIRQALRSDPNLNPHIQASSGWSTISLTGILSNVANKSLMAAYAAIPSVVEFFCEVVDHPDFKTMTSYRMTGVGLFEQVGPTGEIKHGDLTEESYTNQVLTYAKMLSLTRTMMINDDLNAFLQIPRIIGRMAALKREETVFELLLSNPSSFFAAGNNNYLDGATTALDIDSLTAAEQLFLDQVDEDSRPILIQPAILLVPSSLKVTAQQLMTVTQLVGQGASAAPVVNNNPHTGKWVPLASPYLNNSSYTGYSALAWYLFANPNDVAAMQIAYLRGNRTPTLESAEADFNVLGVQWRGYFDWGVAMRDPRGAIKMKGEA